MWVLLVLCFFGACYGNMLVNPTFGTAGSPSIAPWEVTPGFGYTKNSQFFVGRNAWLVSGEKGVSKYFQAVGVTSGWEYRFQCSVYVVAPIAPETLDRTVLSVKAAGTICDIFACFVPTPARVLTSNQWDHSTLFFTAPSSTVELSLWLGAAFHIEMCSLLGKLSAPLYLTFEFDYAAREYQLAWTEPANAAAVGGIDNYQIRYDIYTASQSSRVFMVPFLGEVMVTPRNAFGKGVDATVNLPCPPVVGCSSAIVCTDLSNTQCGSCLDGFTLDNGLGYSRCLPIPEFCEVFSMPFGTSSCVDRAVGAVCTVACSAGYTSSDTTWECMGTGTWENGVECTRDIEYCPASADPNAALCANRTLGASCPLVCNDGFQGGTVRTCSFAHAWIGGVFCVDITPPSVVLTAASPSNVIAVLAQFSEPVFGLSPNSFRVVHDLVTGDEPNVDVSELGDNYIVSVTGLTGEGTVTVSLNAGMCNDASANTCLASNQSAVIVFDNVPPYLVAWTPANGSLVNFANPGVHVAFTEAVIFDGDDTSAVEGAFSASAPLSVIKISATHYYLELDLPMAESREFIVTMNELAISDAVGNRPFAQPELKITLDSTCEQSALAGLQFEVNFTCPSDTPNLQQGDRCFMSCSPGSVYTVYYLECAAIGTKITDWLIPCDFSSGKPGFLEEHTSFGSSHIGTLSEAMAICLTVEDCAGVTLDDLGFTLRVGTDLLPSPINEITYLAVPENSPCSCTLCEAGSYAEGNYCIPCPEGSYNGGEGGASPEACTLCDPGTFSMVPKATSSEVCEPCPDGMFSVAGATACSPCKRGEEPRGEGCAPCDANKRAEEGSLECSTCPGNTVPDEFQEFCRACPTGSYAPPGSTECTVCGDHEVPRGSEGCETCGEFEVANASSTRCRSCPGGSVPNSVLSDCGECPSNAYSLPDSLECATCPAGSAPSPSRTSCSTCADNEQAPAASEACATCPSGSVPRSDQARCVACAPDSVAPAGSVVCTPCADPVGEAPNHDSSVCECRVDFALKNGRCLPCPSGASCTGGAAAPINLAGFYCAGEGVFAACDEGSEVCFANCQCREYHDTASPSCAGCQARAYRPYQGGFCRKCPNTPLALVIVLLFVFGALASLAMIYVARKAKGYFPSVVVGLNFIQMISVLGQLSVRWPPNLAGFFTMLRFFTLDIELMNPECAVSGGSPYFTIWILRFLTPVFILCFFCSVYGAVASYCWHKYRHLHDFSSGEFAGDMWSIDGVLLRRTYKRDLAPWREILRGYKYNIINAFVTMMSVTYLLSTLATFEVFACHSTEQSDGSRVWVLAASPSIECDVSKGPWLSLVLLGTVSLVVYVIGIPCAFVYLLGKNSKRLGQAPVIAKYGLLYRRYALSTFYWEVTIMGRKLVLVGARVFFSRVVWLQVAVCFVLALASFGVTYSMRPFVSHAVNRLEQLCLGCAGAILLVGVIYSAAVPEIRDGTAAQVFSAICILVWIVCIGFVLWVFVREVVALRTRMKYGLPDSDEADDVVVLGDFFKLDARILAFQSALGLRANAQRQQQVRVVLSFVPNTCEQLVVRFVSATDANVHAREEMREDITASTVLTSPSNVAIQVLPGTTKGRTVYMVDALMPTPSRYVLQIAAVSEKKLCHLLHCFLNAEDGNIAVASPGDARAVAVSDDARFTVFSPTQAVLVANESIAFRFRVPDATEVFARRNIRRPLPCEGGSAVMMTVDGDDEELHSMVQEAMDLKSLRSVPSTMEAIATKLDPMGDSIFQSDAVQICTGDRFDVVARSGPDTEERVLAVYTTVAAVSSAGTTDAKSMELARF